MTKGGLMEVIQGGFKKGEWQSDRDAHSDEEIAIWNDRFQWLISQGHTWLKDYLWDIMPEPELKVVK
jgi:hypothetical protein